MPVAVLCCSGAHRRLDQRAACRLAPRKHAASSGITYIGPPVHTLAKATRCIGAGVTPFRPGASLSRCSTMICHVSPGRGSRALPPLAASAGPLRTSIRSVCLPPATSHRGVSIVHTLKSRTVASGTFFYTTFLRVLNPKPLAMFTLVVGSEGLARHRWSQAGTHRCNGACAPEPGQVRHPVGQGGAPHVGPVR